MQQVFERLAVELERPRLLTGQVLRHLAATYGVGRSEAGAFLDERIAAMEDDELDLTLSALFTPKLADQAPFAGLLGAASIPASEWPEWIGRLHRRPTLGHLVTEDGTTHTFPMQPITLERYVHRLRLEGSLPDPLFRLIQTLTPTEDHPLLLAVARRAIWNTAARQEVLYAFLSRSLAADAYSRNDVESLLALMEASEPASIEDVRARLSDWERIVRLQLTEAELPRPFFNDQVQELHGGGRDQRTARESTRAGKHAELAFLHRLARIFAD